MSTGRLLHFNTLKTQAAGRVTGLMVELIMQLRANFASRREDFSVPRDVLAFVRDPLAIRPSEELSSQAKTVLPSLDEAKFEMELTDFQTTSLVKDAYRSAGSLSDFWIACSEEYGAIKKLAMFVSTMFPSTYTCELAFSSMNAIKTYGRNRLTNENLENCLQISVTSVTPDIKKNVTSGKCQFSH